MLHPETTELKDEFRGEQQKQHSPAHVALVRMAYYGSALVDSKRYTRNIRS